MTSWGTVLDLVAATPALRRELCLRCPHLFDAYYAGLRWAPHRERWLQLLAEAYQTARRSLRTAAPRKHRLLLIAPRGHGKSEALCSFAALTILADRNVRCLLICESEAMAEKRLARIKAILTTPAVTADWCRDPGAGWGPIHAPRGAEDAFLYKWGTRGIRIVRPRQTIDWTVEAVGLGGAVTGGHFELIIIDDPETYLTVGTAAQRAKHRLWLQATVGPMLEPGGLEVLVGTRKHADDLYGYALRSGAWQAVVDRAVLRWPTTATPVHSTDALGRQVVDHWETSGDAAVLWAERPIEYLLGERDELGATNFAREFQAEVVDDAQALFRLAWIEAARARGAALPLGTRPPDVPLLIVQAWDPAFTYDRARAAEADADYAVGVCWAADVRTGDRYLLDLARERGATPLEKARRVRAFWRRWAPPATAGNVSATACVAAGWAFSVGMEANSAGEYHRIEAEGLGVPIVSHWTTAAVRDPYAGVPAIASLFERGRVVLLTGDAAGRAVADVVGAELHGLGTEPHDDTVLAIWIAELLLRQALAVWEADQERLLASARLQAHPPSPPRAAARPAASPVIRVT